MCSRRKRKLKKNNAHDTFYKNSLKKLPLTQKKRDTPINADNPSPPELQDTDLVLQLLKRLYCSDLTDGARKGTRSLGI